MLCFFNEPYDFCDSQHKNLSPNFNREFPISELIVFNETSIHVVVVCDNKTRHFKPEFFFCLP